MILTRVVLYFLTVFAVLTGIYLALSAYQRWEENKRLQSEYDANPDQELDRDTFIARGMQEYEGSLKRNLLIGVYGLPLAAFVVLYVLAEYG